MSEAGRGAVPCWRRAADAGLRIRPVEACDLPLVFRIYASTRTEELAPLPWTAAQKDAFLAMQARMQYTGYATTYPAAEHWLMERGEGESIGRLYLDRRRSADHILDIALLPAFRNKGLGGALLTDIITQAADSGKAVTLQVASGNRAIRLYERLGFERVEAQPPFLLMRREAAPVETV